MGNVIHRPGAEVQCPTTYPGQNGLLVGSDGSHIHTFPGTGGHRLNVRDCTRALREACGTCEGLQWVIDNEEERECPDCDGTGVA